MAEYKYDLCVVGGAGHIGLPFALVFAEKGLNVAIYDISQQALDVIGNGVVPFMEEGAEPLLKKSLAVGNLTLSSQPEIVSQSKNIVITIGTPVDEFLNPEFKMITSAFEKLLPYFHDDQLLVLRSTVFPGTTDWLSQWLRSKDKAPLVSFCPERVVQGKAIEEIMNLPQIVCGTTPEAEQSAVDLFTLIGVEIIRLSPMEGEFSKLFSNAYRYITFAIANQFYMITTSAGVDYERVMHGVKYHYPRLDGLAGAGFAAGPCLFKDTMQLNSFAKNEFFLGQAAMNVNEGLVLYIAERLSIKHDLKNMTIGLLGMAFKSNNDDPRTSLSYKMKKVLAFKAKRVLTTDPYVKNDGDLRPLDEVIDQSDILILCAPHRQYKELDTKGRPVVDVWGFLGQGTLF
ncbi:MAG: nucleotide sugar dehydrogenase [Anaerolineales bacterium]|nr:nucleotide sugar dehydrogenase [Anaerolineales bacterium]